MDDFELFITGLEASSKEAELMRLVASMACPQEDLNDSNAELSVLNEESALNAATAKKLEETAEDFLKRASDCSNEVSDCDREFYTHRQTLSEFTTERQSDKEWVKPLLKKGEKIASQCAEADTSMDVLQDTLSKAMELRDEARKRNQEAAASFPMLDLVKEIKLITEQHKMQADLIAEQEAVMELVEDVDAEFERLVSQAQMEEEQMRKMKEDYEKMKALLAEIDPKCELLAEELSQATEEHERLEQKLSECQAKEKERMDREEVANAQLEAALEEKADIEAKVDAEMDWYTKITERMMQEIGGLEQSIAEKKITQEREMAMIRERTEAFLSEAAEFQAELDLISSVRTKCIDEETAEALFSEELEDVQKQIEAIKDQMQKRKDKKEALAKKEDKRLTKKIKAVGKVEVELAIDQAKLDEEASALQERVDSLQKICADLKKEGATLRNEERVARGNYRRAHIMAGREAVRGENNQARSSSGSRATGERRSVDDGGDGKTNKGKKNAREESPRASRGDQTPVPRKIIRPNDSVFGNNINDSNYDVSFGDSTIDMNAPPPDSPLLINTGRVTTSTPMTHKGTASAPPPKSQSRGSRGRRHGKKK